MDTPHLIDAATGNHLFKCDDKGLEEFKKYLSKHIPLIERLNFELRNYGYWIKYKTPKKQNGFTVIANHWGYIEIFDDALLDLIGYLELDPFYFIDKEGNQAYKTQELLETQLRYCCSKIQNMESTVYEMGFHSLEVNGVEDHTTHLVDVDVLYKLNGSTIRVPGFKKNLSNGEFTISMENSLKYDEFIRANVDLLTKKELNGLKFTHDDDGLNAFKAAISENLTVSQNIFFSVIQIGFEIRSDYAVLHAYKTVDGYVILTKDVINTFKEKFTN